MSNTYQKLKNLMVNSIDDARAEIAKIDKDRMYSLEYKQQLKTKVIAKTKACVEEYYPKMQQVKEQVKQGLDQQLKEQTSKPVKLDSASVIALQSAIKDMTNEQLLSLYQKRYADPGQRDIIRENMYMRMEFMPSDSAGVISLATKIQQIDDISLHLLSDEERATKNMIQNYKDVEGYVDAVGTVCKAKIAELENQQIQGAYGVKVTMALHTINKFDHTYNVGDDNDDDN